MNDIDEVHDGWQGGLGATGAGVVKVANHRELRVALEQREHGSRKRVTKFVFELLLKALEGVDEGPKVERCPLVLPKHYIVERAATLVTSLQGGERFRHVGCGGNEFSNLVQGGGQVAIVQVIVG
jgi:hypothetical protein